MEIQPQELIGNWNEGYALDLHILKAIPIERDINDKVVKWENTHSNIGEQLHRLKYYNEYSNINTISKVSSVFLQPLITKWSIDLIVPIPPSDTKRTIQPVFEICKAISENLGIKLSLETIIKLPNKNDTSIHYLKRYPKFIINNENIDNKNILLIDDIYRSGKALNDVALAISSQSKVKNIYVFAVTKAMPRYL